MNCKFTSRIRIEDGCSLVKGCMDVLFVYRAMLEFLIISWSETKRFNSYQIVSVKTDMVIEVNLFNNLDYYNNSP